MFDDDKESIEEDFLNYIKKLRAAADEIIGGSSMYRAFSVKSGFDVFVTQTPRELRR